jgi:hypothetical protein
MIFQPHVVSCCSFNPTADLTGSFPGGGVVHTYPNATNIPTTLKAPFSKVVE